MDITPLRSSFDIKITENISRPSNTISIFPDDIRRITRGTGLQWDEVAQPDIYSCLSDSENVWAIGWILRRNDAGDCVFYRDKACVIYEWRPMICRCYPFFMGERGVEVMHCKRLGNEMTQERATEMARMLKRYEIKKLQSYIGIIGQLGDRLSFASLRVLPRGYEGGGFCARRGEVFEGGAWARLKKNYFRALLQVVLLRKIINQKIGKWIRARAGTLVP